MTGTKPLFHVVMHEPEIPNNTGNIGRTCIATNCALHLIHPLGFETSEKALLRAGLDYWPRVDVRHHKNWEDYLLGWDSGWHSSPSCSEEGEDTGQRPVPPGNQDTAQSAVLPRLWLTSGKVGVTPWDVEIRPGDHLVFGKETRGLPPALLDDYPDRVLRYPMAPGERGLNVATAVCALVYEGIRQCAARGEITIDKEGRLELGR